MENFAVIDIETTYAGDVMSIGVVIADADTFEIVDDWYYVISPFDEHPAKFADVVYIEGFTPDERCSRSDTMRDLLDFFNGYEIESIFAYNAQFDYSHLPELRDFIWHDIMRLAAYRQYNMSIPDHIECTKTGRIKKGYRVEDIYRMLTGDDAYYETHNALMDAMDELEIMRLLTHPIDTYEIAQLRYI